VDNQRREFTVDDHWVERASRAFIWRVASGPRGCVRFVLMVGAGVLAGSTLGGSSVLALVAGGAVGLLLLGLLYATLPRRLRAQMYRDGYRPGRVVSADYDDTGVLISTVSGTRRHDYADIRRVRVAGDLVLVRMEDRLTVVFPRELVPGQRIDALRAALRS
jgi:hypothetical protein